MNITKVNTRQALLIGLKYRQLGDLSSAIELFQKILEIEPDNLDACSALAYSTLTGDSYQKNLGHFHEYLKPKTYVEIGVCTGESMALVKPPTIAIGVDPKPKIKETLHLEPKIYEMTSDKFFADYDLKEEMESEQLDLVFLDGLHLFEQTLRDFINIERYASPQTVVLIHDCLPLNSLTAKRDRVTKFWSGDPWKIIPILKKYRPDLNVFTIPSAPTGLGVVTGLDSESQVLDDAFDEIVSEFIALDYDYGREESNLMLNVIENNWSSITSNLGQ